jgi:hypothetical protein
MQTDSSLIRTQLSPVGGRRLEVRSMSQGSMHYGEPAYWEARYQEELRKSMIKMESFDWYMLFEPSELENGFLTDLY